MKEQRKLLKNNPYYVLKLLCNSIDIRFSPIWHYQHKEDLKYPLLSSYYRILRSKGVECVIVESTTEQLPLLPTPSIAYTSLNGGTSFVIEDADEASIKVRNEENDIESIELEFFNHYWDGKILVVNKEHEVATPKEAIADKVKMTADKLKYPLLIMTLFAIVGYVFFTKIEARSLLNFWFIGLYILGISTAVLLQIRQIDKNNKLVNKICHAKNGSKKVDCSSILDSKDAYFFGIFSWTDFGTLYFLTLFLLMLILPGKLSETIGILSSLLAFPYVFYSVFYQWKIAKSWCRLCLATQAAIIMLFILSIVCLIINGINIQSLLSTDLLPALVIMLASVIMFVYVKPNFEKSLLYDTLNIKYNWLKHNPIVLESIFNQQPIVCTKELEHIVISPDTNDRITIIYNTVCSPCNREITKLIDLYKRKVDAGIEIIFFLDEQDLASIYAAKVIYSRYLSDNQNFLDFLYRYASGFPTSANSMIEGIELPLGREKELSDIITRQNEWCKRNNILSTPRLYFNDVLVPEIYSINDIDIMCM